METPIKLELVGRKGDMYALKYPGLHIPIHVNYELLEKFKESDEYLVLEDVTSSSPPLERNSKNFSENSFNRI
ncbi:hypothetical protein ACFSYG_19650 [Leeuwenhoekiella polynyae]|uniref:Uncharacterized protein n=1 Tax=Leeuwenhoekiella polynyae TaxID=1550906 RepID=A0A4Q0PFE7_9FLAO|nr:hypothetical protein [Leeuwenhoekiella polynyae]RXG25236.1 hypothetical protein DSM02_1206 [Leeuwenhoekiella polynyae]